MRPDHASGLARYTVGPDVPKIAPTNARSLSAGEVRTNSGTEYRERFALSHFPVTFAGNNLILSTTQLCRIDIALMLSHVIFP